MKRKTHPSKEAPSATMSRRQAAKAKRKAAKAERKAGKAQRNVPLSLHRRPIVCPPDRAGRSLWFRLAGHLCRTLVIWAAAAGLTLFLSGAMEYPVPTASILLATLIVVAEVALFTFHPVGGVLSIGSTSGLTVWMLLTRPAIFSDLINGFAAMYNGILDRLYRAGFLSYVQYKTEIHSSTPTEELLSIGMCFVGGIIALAFAICLIRRVRIIPPAILSTTLLVVVLTFNLYSNRNASNLGVALVIVSFATLLVMAAYDRLYHTKNTQRYDTELRLFEGDDDPTPPPPLNKEERKSREPAAKAKRKAYRHRRHQVKRYHRVTAQSRAAMGGFASAAVMILCLLIIALPALTITGNFTTIPAIDEKVSYARDYVTAILRGDDERLDELEYGADKDNFLPHSADLEQLNFTGKQIFRVETYTNKANVYLRGWIGTDYKDGGWQAVDDDTLAAWRTFFTAKDSPAESLRYDFYHAMAPHTVDGENDPDRYLSSPAFHKDLGFVAQHVSLRRINSPDTLCYLPSFHDPRFGVMKFASTTPTDLTYVNYFDGLYTGRNFDEEGVAYAAIAYTPLMTEETWAETQAALLASYHLQKEALLARIGYTVDEHGEVDSEITLTVVDMENGYHRFVYQLGTDTWYFLHPSDTVIRKTNAWDVETDHGTLRISVQRGTGLIRDVILNNAATPNDTPTLLEQYDTSDEDAGRALIDSVTDHRLYSDFVYDTYTQKSDSAYIAELAALIKAQAHTVYPVVEWTEILDDPNTPEDEYDLSYTVDYPAVDVSLAHLRDSALTDTYVQRDVLVRNVIDYIISDMGCTYTITPDLSKVDPLLDGVENFLQNTKQGYCVQFASAAALLLREMNIPVRFVEGYIANDFHRNTSDTKAPYVAYVHDYEAHAWIEVYFDGVGWIPYETTPQYYTAMYGDHGVGSHLPDRPEPPVTSPEEHDKIPPEEDTLPETDTVAEQESETDEAMLGNPNAAAITRGGLIALGVMAVLVAIVLLLRHVVGSARYAEEQRQSIVEQVMESGFGTNTNETDRQHMALTMTDGITHLLSFYGLAPRTGEFRDDYADRLTAEFNLPADAPTQEERLPTPDWHQVMDAVAAEEFGRGMSIAEMKQVAYTYRFLRTHVRHRIPLPRRIFLRYVKHLL